VFSFDAEIAGSNTQADISQQLRKKADWGARFDSSTRKGPFFLKTTFTRLEPDFLSLNARQLADLQDIGVRGGFDLGSHVTVEGAYRQTSNNLRGIRTDGTTTFRVPEVRVSLRQVPGLGRSIFDVGYRVREQEGPKIAGQTFVQDKTTKIPFVEASIPLGSTLISAGYEHRDNHDGHFADQSSGTNRIYGSLRSIFDIKGWQISPNFRYEIERELFILVNGANDNRSILASLYVDAPKYFVLEMVYRQVGATLFSQCLTSGTDFCQSLRAIPAGTVVLLPSGFGRPAYRAALTYKIRNSEDRTIIFSFDRNQNYFALPDRNFSERVIAVTLLWRFKK
jgi:hypothetical protein